MIRFLFDKSKMLQKRLLVVIELRKEGKNVVLKREKNIGLSGFRTTDFPVEEPRRYH